MNTKAEDLIPKLARNEVFYFIARSCMIGAIPLIGYFGSRMLTQADAMQSAIAQQNVDLRILSLKLDGNISQLSDHELRLRAIERR